MIKDSYRNQRLLEDLKFGSTGGVGSISLCNGEVVYSPSYGPLTIEKIQQTTVTVSPLWDVENQVEDLQCYKSSFIECDDFRRVARTFGGELTLSVEEVASSMIQSVEYKAVAQILTVTFNNGSVYNYYISDAEYGLALVDAAEIATQDPNEVCTKLSISPPSVGKVFNALIKEKYTARKLN